MGGSRLAIDVKLVGRDPQLDLVERAVREVRAGGSRTLVVMGEPGIGKTALLEVAAAHAAAAGLLTLEGRAAEHEREVPFALAVAALDDHVATLHPTRVSALAPVLGDVLPSVGDGGAPSTDGAAERFRYHRALRTLVELLGRERPAALILDDLHWADDASVEFVQHLLRRPPRTPHLLVLALRPGSPEPLLQAAMPAEGMTHVWLEPLGHDDSLALLAGVSDRRVRERIARESGGNPLFLSQLARFADAPEGTVPPCVLAAVGLEVALLGADEQTLLQGAAVAGDPFDPELAVAAAECVGDLDLLVSAGLVRATGSGRAFAFRHPLVRRAVYDGVPPAWRLGAHERIASALAQRGAGARVRAHHVERFAHVGDESAIELLLEAAAAAGASAPATAARWYAAALRLVPETDGRRVDLRARRALSLAAAGQVREARDELVEVLAVRPQDPRLVVACAGLEKLLHRPAEARRRLLAALEQAPPQHHAELALELAVLGVCYDGATRSWASRARAASTDPALIVAADAAEAAGALLERDALGAVVRLDAARDGLRALDDTALAGRLAVSANAAIAELMAERFADAAASATRGLAVARATGQGQLNVTLSAVAAVAHAERLDLAAALIDVDNADESARLQDVAFGRALVAWARMGVHDLRGEFTEAVQAADELAALRLDDGFVLRDAALIAASLHAERDPERCLTELLALAGPRLERTDVTAVTRTALVAARCAIALGRVDDAELYAQVSSEFATAMSRGGGLLGASAARGATARAEVLLARGEASLAATAAREAVSAAARAGARREECSARVLAGRALAATGDAELAKAELRRAADDARRGGALALVGDAARELRKLGTRIPGPNASAAPEGALTGRERDVADLVAQGRSNKQVAADLFLSEKTIESTLTRVYAKLGVRSRVELVRRLAPV